MGRPRPISRPWSRTGENPPYGILGGTMETSASFEARSAPSSYPTASQAGFCALSRDPPETGLANQPADADGLLELAPCFDAGINVRYCKETWAGSRSYV